MKTAIATALLIAATTPALANIVIADTFAGATTAITTDLGTAGATPNRFFETGLHGSDDFVLGAGTDGSGEFRTFISLDNTAFAGPITSASFDVTGATVTLPTATGLRVTISALLPCTPSGGQSACYQTDETYTDQGAFDLLGDGAIYGTIDLSAGQTSFSIALNAAGVAALNDARTQVGQGNVPIFALTAAPLATPAPAAIALFGLGLTLLAARRAR